MSKKLNVPDNITLMPLPPRSPELNPVENIWQFIRDNWLSNRVFENYDAIIDAGCDAFEAKPVNFPNLMETMANVLSIKGKQLVG